VRARKLLRDGVAAVSATRPSRSLPTASVARLLEPLSAMVGENVDLHEARETFERLQAEFSPPPGTSVRPVTAGGVPSLVVSPLDHHEATVIYLHGGSYLLGSAFGYRPHAGALAAAAQTGVLVPDYRLAPEHPFPAALEDALSAYRWLLDQGVPAERVTVAGDSAGGGLVMSLLLTLKRESEPPPGGAVLFCPWLDLRLEDTSLSAAGEPAEARLATDTELRRCVDAYLNGHPSDDPIVDPLAADLAGLPPMLIQAATGDARVVDAEALAARAREQAVEVRFELYPVQAHAFQLFWSFLPEAADAFEAAGEFIRTLDGRRNSVPASDLARG
jgi:acetyl esterase/lipase